MVMQSVVDPDLKMQIQIRNWIQLVLADPCLDPMDRAQILIVLLF